jgi:hypothetical protein
MQRNLLLLLSVPALLATAASAGAEDGEGRIVFAWTPGEPTAKTAAGAVPFRLAEGVKLVDCPVGKAAVPGTDGRIGAADVKLGKLPEQGTISMWLRFSREVQLSRTGGASARLLHCADATISLSEGAGGPGIGIVAGEHLRNPKYRDRFGCGFTHLRAGQWYHFVITYNAPVQNAWRGILNGVTQPEPWWQHPWRFRNDTTRVELAGLLTRKGAAPLRITLGPVTWRSGQATAKQVRAELKAVDGWRVPPNRGEGLQEYAEPFDPEKLGGGILFEQRFDAPLPAGQWVMEGPGRMAVEGGRLVVRNTDHCTFWLKHKLPRDFVAAWDIQPSQVEGLAIVFIAADGIDGRDLFDPTLAKRTGLFNQYVRGDIRSYHFSYYAGTRGSANGRKNPGLQMVAMCRDIIGAELQAGKKGPWRVALIRRGARIDLAVDGRRFLTFTDDPKLRGPVHGAGYFGLRQMKRSKQIAYDNLVIRRVKPAPMEREVSE